MAKSYKEKLSDKRWQIKKTAILDRDNWKCTNPKCKSDDTVQLQVHHLMYLGANDPWDYPDDMLITLCKYCHDAENGREDLEKHLANTLRMKGFLISDLLAMSCKLEKDTNFAKRFLNILREFQNG